MHIRPARRAVTPREGAVPVPQADGIGNGIRPGAGGPSHIEDFTVGDVYEHPLGRTVLDADNIWFTCVTMNTNPIHFDGEYSKRTSVSGISTASSRTSFVPVVAMSMIP